LLRGQVRAGIVFEPCVYVALSNKYLQVNLVTET